MGKFYWEFTLNEDEQKKYQEKMELCYVAFIDILGFKEMVSKEIDKVILAQRQIKGFALERFNNVNGYRCFDDSDLDEEEKEEEFENYIPKVTMFSDSIVISAKERNVLLGDFIDFISDLQYFFLLEGITLRGGIEVGQLYHDEFMVFGEGLVSAYLLESEKAKYPRILVGKTAIKRTVERYDERFNDQIDRSIEDNLSEIEKANIYENYYSSFAIGNVVREDGLSYLNYLFDRFDVFKDDCACQKIKDVIVNGTKNENEAVREKYIWLKGYFNFIIENAAKEKMTDKNSDRIQRIIEERCI